MADFSNYQIKELILAAARRLNKEKELQKDIFKLDKAIQTFKQEASPGASQQELANIALLGVMKVYIAGTVRPVIRVNWGNTFAAPDYNTMHGDSGGGSAIDQGNRVDYQRGDPLGTEARAIINLLESGEFDEDFVNYLNANHFDVQGRSKAATPFKTTPVRK